MELLQSGLDDQEGLQRPTSGCGTISAPIASEGQPCSQDMEKGIPCEIDYIVGICSQWGRKLGIPTPTCDTIISIVKDFENGTIPMPTMACLDRFVLPNLL